MSENNSNVGKNDDSSNIGNDDFKYYYESGNVTYEDIDTCNKYK